MKEKITNNKLICKIKQRPIIVMIIQLIIALICTVVLPNLLSLGFMKVYELFKWKWLNSFNASLCVSEILGFISLLIVSWLMGYRKLYKKPHVLFKTIWLTILPLTSFILLIFIINWYACMNTYICIRRSDRDVFIGILMFLFVGLFEELCTRGLLLNICLKYLPKNTKGMWLSLIISSLIFGAGHIANYINGGAFIGVLQQIIFAVGMGCFLGAIYLRTGSLLLVSLLHGTYDLVASLEDVFFKEKNFFASFSYSSWYSVIPAIPCILLAMIILRKGYSASQGLEAESRWEKILFVISFIILTIVAIGFLVFIIYYTSLNGIERRILFNSIKAFFK